MDREIPVPNRYIDRKMKQLQHKKHRQTLYNIKLKHKNPLTQNTESPSTKITRHSSSFLENKNLSIQRENICLFNKIANIIRQKPKNVMNRSYGKTLEESMEKMKKKQQRIKTENEQIQKRLFNQKSTIQNKAFYKDRRQNLKYLKFIGRYPYQSVNKPQNDKQQKCDERQRESISSVSKIGSIKSMREYEKMEEIQIFRKKTKDSFVKIMKICNSYYIFYVQVDGKSTTYKYTMPKNTFEEQLLKSNNNYEKVIGRLRLTDDQTMIFQYF